jgi:hypothetical protein
MILCGEGRLFCIYRQVAQKRIIGMLLERELGLDASSGLFLERDKRDAAMWIPGGFGVTDPWAESHHQPLNLTKSLRPLCLLPEISYRTRDPPLHLSAAWALRLGSGTSEVC